MFILILKQYMLENSKEHKIMEIFLSWQLKGYLYTKGTKELLTFTIQIIGYFKR